MRSIVTLPIGLMFVLVSHRPILIICEMGLLQTWLAPSHLARGLDALLTFLDDRSQMETCLALASKLVATWPRDEDTRAGIGGSPPIYFQDGVEFSGSFVCSNASPDHSPWHVWMLWIKLPATPATPASFPSQIQAGRKGTDPLSGEAKRFHFGQVGRFDVDVLPYSRYSLESNPA